MAVLRSYEHELWAQGYLLHRPMPVDQLLTTVHADRAAPVTLTAVS